MSMNLEIIAEREVYIPKTGKSDIERRYYSVWQTPTKVTFKILESENPCESYIEWVRSISKDCEEDIYEDGDIFHEKEPIGKRVVNSGEDHIKGLLEWFQEMNSEGYEIKYEYM